MRYIYTLPRLTCRIGYATMMQNVKIISIFYLFNQAIEKEILP